MINRYADLHTHTTASDGRTEPLKLVEMAKQNKLHAIAITDHDTVSGIKTVLENKIDNGVEVIPGVEVSVDFKPVMHILGLFVDIGSKQLNDMLNKICREKKHLMVQAFRMLSQRGINLNVQEVMKNEKILSVNDLSEYLVQQNYFRSRDDVDAFFENLRIEWRNALPTPKICIETIHSARGVAILAHPVVLHMNDDDLRSLIIELKNWGLDGVEIYHPKQSLSYRNMLSELVAEIDLLVSGGSDFHGKWDKESLSSMASNTDISYVNIFQMKKRIEGRRK